MVDWAYVNGAPEDEDCLGLYDVDPVYDPGAHLGRSSRGRSQRSYVHKDIRGSKTCNKCNTRDLHWTQHYGKWRLAYFDGSLHDCFEKEKKVGDLFKPIKTDKPKVFLGGNMNKQEHAFPQLGEYGLTIRDYFAAKAMQGFLANPRWGELAPEKIAEWSYDQAAAMMGEREK